MRYNMDIPQSVYEKLVQLQNDLGFSTPKSVIMTFLRLGIIVYQECKLGNSVIIRTPTGDKEIILGVSFE